MCFPSAVRTQSRLELELEQAVDLFFDSVTPIIPVFLVNGEESDHELSVQAANILLLLHRSSFENRDLASGRFFCNNPTNSTGNFSNSMDGAPIASSDSSGGSSMTAGHTSAVWEHTTFVEQRPAISLFDDEALRDAKALTPEEISMILNMIELHTKSVSHLTREHREAELDASQTPETTQQELIICRKLIKQEFRNITLHLRWIRTISAWRAGLHHLYDKMEWMDDKNEYRKFIVKFRLAFAEHKTKRTDKMIVGMKKYFSIMKEAMEMVEEAHSDQGPWVFQARVLPGLTRFCDNLRHRADDRIKERGKRS